MKPAAHSGISIVADDLGRRLATSHTSMIKNPHTILADQEKAKKEEKGVHASRKHCIFIQLLRDHESILRSPITFCSCVNGGVSGWIYRSLLFFKYCSGCGTVLLVPMLGSGGLLF